VTGAAPLRAVLLAALLAGFGGLLAEIIALRRMGLVLGNTAEAAALVLSVFLGGLGLGSFAGPRAALARARPLAAASLGYAAVALAMLAGDALLMQAGPQSGVAAIGLALAFPGVPALLMGAAFPPLFVALGRDPPPLRVGLLVALNLMGSVAAAFLGGNFLVPGVGLTASAWIGSAAYLATAATLAVAARAANTRPPAAPVPPAAALGSLRRAAFASGLLVLGLEVFLLRRLPFFLEGLQPTFAGVLAVACVSLAGGAAFGTPLLARLGEARAPSIALALGAVLGCAGLHESLSPRLARVPVDSEWGLHARIAVAVAAAAAPAFACLGAVLPLCLIRFRHPETRAPAAGSLLCWQGLGALAGALLAGHALPLLAPRAYFAATPAALALLALAVAWGRERRLACGAAAAAVVILCGSGLGGAGTPWRPRPPVAGSRNDRPGEYAHLEHRTDAVTTASVAYNRRDHSVVLFTDEFRATETGPRTAYMRGLGHLPFLLREGLRDVAVIGLGTGITYEAVSAWPEARAIDLVEISPAVVELARRFTADGPIVDGRAPRFAGDPRVRLHVTDGRRFLARKAPGSLDLVTMEPLLPYQPATVPLYTREFYELVRRALRPAGLLVQWVPTHALPRDFYDLLLATFARSFPHASAWLLDNATLLVGSSQPHAPDPSAAAARHAAAEPDLRFALYECGLAGPHDVGVALVSDSLTPLAAVGELMDDRPVLERVGYWSGEARLSFLADNLGRLRDLATAAPPSALAQVRVARLSALAAQAAAATTKGASLDAAVRDIARARTAAPAAVLLHREESAMLRQTYERDILAAAGAGAGPRARRLLRRDPGSALLWASVAAAAEEPARARALAVATGLDPLLFARPPAFLAHLAPREPTVSPREDLGFLPQGPELAAAASSPDARAAVLRATFPARCCRALWEAAARRPLASAEAEAILPILDPYAFGALASVVAARAGDLADEVLPLWRRDLPLPPALAALLVADERARAAFADALAGRGGRDERTALASLLLDEARSVRVRAGAALALTAGGRIEYDPDAEETARRTAADRLRSLHNQPP
jgi:spermidine synthase